MMNMRQINKEDIIASIVVFLVAMPLCLGVALASNAPLFSGILAGIIGGLVVGYLSQSHVSVSGPSPGMIAVVIAGIYQLGSFNAFLTALVLAGLIQIGIGRLKAGFVADFVPSNVVQGLLSAIGVLIIIKQLPFAFGFFAEKQTILAALKHAQQTLDFSQLTYLTHHVSHGAVVITCVSFVVLFYWDRLKNGILKSIPGPLIVVLLGIFANLIFEHFIPILHLSNREHLVSLPKIDNLFQFKHLLHYPTLSALTHYKVYSYGFLIAIVASIETLLNLEAAEKVDAQKRYCSRNKELIAQGMGNVLSGMLGGLPITSVIVRTTVNVNSGAKSKNAAMLHGMWLLLAVTLIPHWINKIPLASLAAILIYVGLKLASLKTFKTMYDKGFEYFLPFIVSVVAIVLTNLLSGIICGLLVSAFLVMKNNSKPHFKEKLEVYPSGNVLRILLPEQATFLNKASLIGALRKLPDNAQVILDGRKTLYLDHDIRELIHDFSLNLSKEKNISLRLEGFNQSHQIMAREDFNNITTKRVQMRLDPADVLTILKEGNKRYVKEKPLNREINAFNSTTSKAQHPIAAVISCIDSRVPVESIFDAGVGDLFVARVAGNIINTDIVASMEYASAVSGAKLILVLGHTDCGAIKAACGDENRGLLTHLLDRIKPAVIKVRQDDAIKNNDDFFTRVTIENIRTSISTLKTKSAVLTELVKDNKLVILGAMYDIETGLVRLMDIDESIKPAELDLSNVLD